MVPGILFTVLTDKFLAITCKPAYLVVKETALN
jgi:hypothetical protein